LASPQKKGLLGSLQSFFEKLTEYFETLILYLQKSAEASVRGLAVRSFWFLIAIICVAQAIGHLGQVVYGMAILIFNDPGYSHLTTSGMFLILGGLSIWYAFRRI
jgi:hypothetical protein